LDYHQGYKDGVFTGSSLLTPEHREWVEKAASVAEKYNPLRKLFFVEWDHPGDAEEIPTPGVFVMLEPGRVKSHNYQFVSVPKPGDGWEDFLLELASAAGFSLTEGDLPEFPLTLSSNPRFFIGLFPARIKDTVWFRFIHNFTLKEARSLCEEMSFDTRWLDKIDVEKNALTPLISFDLYPDGLRNPCAEIILKKGVPDTMPEFIPIAEHLHEKIMEKHGSVLTDLRVSHFKVPLTPEGWDSGLVKMYLMGSTVEGYKAIPVDG
jgi:hypothetical protein